MVERFLIAVVDDDVSVRESLPDLLREFGFAARTFASAEEFLASGCVGEAHCLILDIAMPGMSGCSLKRELRRRRQAVPIVFITAHDDDLRACMLDRALLNVFSSHSPTPRCSARSRPRSGLTEPAKAVPSPTPVAPCPCRFSIG